MTLKGHDTKTEIPRTIGARPLADRLGISKSLVRKWHREGVLRGVLLKGNPTDRGRLVFLESDVLAFLAARGIGPREAA